MVHGWLRRLPFITVVFGQVSEMKKQKTRPELLHLAREYQRQIGTITRPDVRAVLQWKIHQLRQRAN